MIPIFSCLPLWDVNCQNLNKFPHHIMFFLSFGKPFCLNTVFQESHFKSYSQPDETLFICPMMTIYHLNIFSKALLNKIFSFFSRIIRIKQTDALKVLGFGWSQ